MSGKNLRKKGGPARLPSRPDHIQTGCRNQFLDHRTLPLNLQKIQASDKTNHDIELGALKAQVPRFPNHDSEIRVRYRYIRIATPALPLYAFG